MNTSDESRRRALVHDVKNVLTTIKVEAQRAGRTGEIPALVALFFSGKVDKAVELLDEFLNVGKER